MPSQVILPRVDMDMATGKISKWLVSDGTRVNKGQPLFEIETDKAAMEIEAEASGTLHTLAQAGADDLAVGSVVGWIYGEGEAPVAEPARADAVAPAAASPQTAAEPLAASAATPAVAAARGRATPLARRLARERGLDLAALTGTGPRGRVQAADVPSTTATDAPARAETTDRASAPVPEAMAAEAPPAARPGIQPSPAAGGDPRLAAPDRGALKLLRDGEGVPIVLVHGFGSDMNGWRPLLSGYGGGRPVLALDLPGHGATPLGAVADFDSLVDAVEDQLQASGLRAMVLVGHSLGAAVVAAIAGRGTLDLRAVLLVAPAGLGPEINGPFITGYLGASSEASLGPWMRELVEAPEAMTPTFVRATLGGRGSVLPSQRRIAAAVFPDGTQAFSIRPALARIGCPVRIVVGTADRIIPARQADGLPPLVALHRLPGIGHLPQMEDRATLLAILAQTIGA